MALTEGNYRSEGLLSELPGRQSREAITLLSGQNITKPMTVLGKILSAAATAAAVAGNTGNGTCSAVTVAAGVKVGVHRVLFIEPTTNLGTFLVEDPDGVIVGRGFVGTAFSGGGLGFTISDGATDFVAGDQFTITVAAGSGKWVALDLAATTGGQIAAGIANGAVDASAADAPGVAFVRGIEVADKILTWPAGISGPQKTAAIAQLAALNPPILVRTTL